MTGKVVHCDLRPYNRAEEALQEVARLLSDYSNPDLRLLLVLDTPQTLTKHALVYEELWRSRRVEKLLSIAVGPLILPEGLQIPGSIGPDGDSGVIWVGDLDGVNWGLTAPAIAVTHTDEKSEAGLDKLLNILSMPEVFRTSLALIADIPERVASPGLNIFEVTASQSMFLIALNRCIKKTLDLVTPDLRAGIATIADKAWAVDKIRSAVIPTGRLAVARDRCLTQAKALTDTVDSLSTSAALYGVGKLGAKVHDLAVSAGTELNSYRSDAQTLVATRAAERADRLYDWGVRPMAGSDSTHDDIAAAIESSVQAGEPLAVVSLRLRDYERKMRAQGDLSYSEQIEHVSPHALAQRFTEPEPTAGPEPWLVAVAATAVAVASLGRSLGIVGGLVVALTWMGLLGLTIVRAPGGRLADHRGSLIADGIAAVFGLAGGIVLARILNPPLLVGVIGFVIGLGAVIVAATFSWRVRTRRWRDTLQAEDIGKAAAALTSIVIAASNREWSASESRQDTMITAKAAVDGATSGLQAYQQKLDQDLPPDPIMHSSRPEFDAYVCGALNRLVSNALRPILRASKPGTPREHEEWARKRVGELLAEWEEHVYNYGPLDLPEFAKGQGAQASALSDNDIAIITTIITDDPRDTMWQLCRSAEIRLLDTGIPKVPCVRFAPETVHESSSGVFSVETIWISSTKHAGMLRLVPVRPGLASRTWLTNDELDEWPTASGPEGRPPVDGEEVP